MSCDRERALTSFSEGRSLRGPTETDVILSSYLFSEVWGPEKVLSLPWRQIGVFICVVGEKILLGKDQRLVLQ